MAMNPEHSETPAEVKARAEAFRGTFAGLKGEIGKVMVGQHEVIDAVLICLFAGRWRGR
jgi:MoxR-like ATPase